MATFTGDGADNIFTGGSENDTATGNGGADQLSGGGGNDNLAGNAGTDTLNGGDGDDVLWSHDLLVTTSGIPSSSDIFTEVDSLNGGAGDDTIFAGYGDNVDGGSSGYSGNTLHISFMSAPSGVNADFRLLTGGRSITIGGGVIQNIQKVGFLEGSNFDDILAPIDQTYAIGSSVYGRGGNDTIIANYYSGWAGGGLWGGDGNDTIDATGTQYGVKVFGEAGDDTIRMRSGLGDVADGGDGNDTIYAGGLAYGGAGNDLIIMQFTYYQSGVYGGDGDDEVRASAQGNTISGGRGADLLIGGSQGPDYLASGDFQLNTFTAADDMDRDKDVLRGGGGDDTLAIGFGDDGDGGAGNDTLRLSLGGSTLGLTFNSLGSRAQRLLYSLAVPSRISRPSPFCEAVILRTS